MVLKIHMQHNKAAGLQNGKIQAVRESNMASVAKNSIINFFSRTTWYTLCILLVLYRYFTEGDLRFTLRPCVRLSDCPSIRLPSAKSESRNNLNNVWSLFMKLVKWTDGQVQIMHVLLYCSFTVTFGCYVNLKFLFHWLIMGEIVNPAIT